MPDGETLLAASLALPCSELLDVWVVVRPEDKREDLAIPTYVNLVHNSCAADGMGKSLAVGMKVIVQSSSADAVAIFLGDMPWIRAESLRALLAAGLSDRIIVPTYKGQAGHPVVFGREFWPDLYALTGDNGAKSVIKRYPHAVRHLELKDPGIFRDIDTPVNQPVE